MSARLTYEQRTPEQRFGLYREYMAVVTNTAQLACLADSTGDPIRKRQLQSQANAEHARAKELRSQIPDYVFD